MISTWVAYELSLIDEALTLVDPPYTATSANLLFVTSIGERYYAWFMLFFVFLMALSGRDWGPMYYAEIANKHIEMSDGAESLAQFYGIPQVQTKEGVGRGRWWNGAVVPVTFLSAVLPLMYYNGACAVTWGGYGKDSSFADAIGNADPYAVLIWLALLLICVMMLMYFVQGVGTYWNWQTKGVNGAKYTGPFAPLLWPKEAIGAACEQVGMMWEVFVVLIFARCIGNIVKLLGELHSPALRPFLCC
jgi:Na+/H+ antiporter NhaC